MFHIAAGVALGIIAAAALLRNPAAVVKILTGLAGLLFSIALIAVTLLLTLPHFMH